MKRKLDQKQTNRAEIWNEIFTVPSEDTIPHRMTLISSQYPPIQDATVIQTNLILPSFVSSPCNSNNRKKWTTTERKKASYAKEALSRGFLKAVSSDIAHQYLSLSWCFVQVKELHKKGKRRDGDFIRIPSSLYAG
jgi:hypothetical protein